MVAAVVMLATGTAILVVVAVCSRFLAASAWIMVHYTLVALICVAAWKCTSIEQREVIASFISQSQTRIEPSASTFVSSLYGWAKKFYRAGPVH